jgi:DNA replication ATP-dependent helicase Dna2
MVVNRQIKDKTGGEWGKEGKIHRYTYSFVRSRTWVTPFPSSPTQSPTSTRSLLNGHLNTGDPITVSIEPNLLALARGYILELNPEEIIIGVDHVLDAASLKERVQRMRLAQGHDDDSDLVFRIDKDELFGSMARVRSNLTQLFYTGGDAKRLSLVVDLRKPIFSAPTPPFVVAASNPSTPPHLAHLNPSQLDAMHRVLSAEDYALILGMPGTGKTTVIAALIRELVRRGKTVLLSSYTHSAVDTILMKLENEGGGKDGAGASFGVLRLGNADKVCLTCIFIRVLNCDVDAMITQVHPDVRKYTLNARRTATTVEQLEAQLMSPPVVATTCLSIDQCVTLLLNVGFIYSDINRNPLLALFSPAGISTIVSWMKPPKSPYRHV